MKNRIAELRKTKNMNQKDLAEKLGLTQSAISAWETGRNQPDIESLYKMSELFVARAEYIMGYDIGEINGYSKEEFNKKAEEEARREAYNADYENIYEEVSTEEAEQRMIEEQLEYEKFQTDDTMPMPQTYESYKASKEIDKLSHDDREKILKIIEAFK